MLFRLAEQCGAVDPWALDREIPAALVSDWARYYRQKEERYDKLEYYAVKLCRFVAAIGGIDQEDIVMPREDDEAGGDVHVKPEEAFRALALAMGATPAKG